MVVEYYCSECGSVNQLLVGELILCKFCGGGYYINQELRKF